MTKFTPHYTLEKTAAGAEFWKWNGYKVTDPATLDSRLFAEGGLLVLRDKFANTWRVPMCKYGVSNSSFLMTTYTLSEAGKHSCSHVWEYPDGSGYMSISAGQDTPEPDAGSSTGIGCDIDVVDYPVLELRIASVMRKIWTHPHYRQSSGTKQDFKACQKRGADWLAGYLA